MEIDVKRVNSRFVVGLETTVAIDQHRTHGAHIDLVRMGGEIVLVTIKRITDGDDPLTTLLEPHNLTRQLL